MAALSTTAFLAKWATLFANNSSRDISEEDVRDFRQDIADSFLNTVDRSYTGTVILLSNFDASVNTFPSTGLGSASDGSIKKGDTFLISVAGTLDGNPVLPGDLIIASVDSATNSDADWVLVQSLGSQDLQAVLDQGSAAAISTQLDVETSAGIRFAEVATGNEIELSNADGGSVRIGSTVTLESGGFVYPWPSSAPGANDYVLKSQTDGTLSWAAQLWGEIAGTITDQTDLVNYITSRLEALKWKASVVVATTANITLSGEQTIDGILTSGSRVLVKNQSTASQNGIYVSAAGAWSRASDANSADELQSAVVSVEQGTSNENTTWVQTADSITVGSTSITWSQLGVSVSNADETTKGIVEEATLSEVNAGTGTGGTGAELFVAPDKLASSKYLDQSNSKLFAVASGTDTYTATLSPAIAAYGTGQVVWIQFTNASTSTTPTINLNSLGAKTIVKRNNTALVSGDIAAGQIYALIYDGTNFRLMGIANTGVLVDLLLTNQAATSSTKNPVHVDDTGKLTKTIWQALDTTNRKITSTGSDDLESTTQEEWLNNSGTYIMKVLNGLKVQFGGTSAFWEVNSGISDGNAGIIALISQDIGFRLKDGGSFDYLVLKTSTTGNGRALIIKQKQINNEGIGFETIRRQYKLTLPNTTAATRHLIAQIPVTSGFGIQIHIHNAMAYATNGNMQSCEPFSAIGANASGTTAGTVTTPTALRVTATTGGFDGAFNNTSDEFEVGFTNETGTGRQYDVVVDLSYIIYPIPV